MESAWQSVTGPSRGSRLRSTSAVSSPPPTHVPSFLTVPLTRQESAAAEAAGATSVQLTTQLMQRLCGVNVARGRLHGSLEFPKRIPPAPLLEIDAPKVHERELARLVASRLLCLLEPQDGLVELPLLPQVDPDVVVGVVEAGVDLDRTETLGRGLRLSAR